MTDKGNGTKCIICHGNFHPYSMGEKNGFQLVACKNCGTVMADPLPGKEEVEAFFGEIQPEITHLTNPEAEIETVRKSLIRAGGASGIGRKFLDVGSRHGYAVMAAKALGYEAQGIDSHDFFVRFSQEKYGKENFTHASAMDFAANRNQYSFIYAAECFSEQTDPEAFTAALAALLAPGGTLYIEEADGNSFNLPHKFTNWSYADPPLNFLYLSKKGITSLLGRHGLNVQKILFNWLPLMRLIVTKR